jgi:hypothetical protein
VDKGLILQAPLFVQSQLELLAAHFIAREAQNQPFLVNLVNQQFEAFFLTSGMNPGPPVALKAQDDIVHKLIRPPLPDWGYVMDVEIEPVRTSGHTTLVYGLSIQILAMLILAP